MQEGIVISNISNIYLVEIEEKVYECTARGKLKKEENQLMIGDKVLVEKLDTTDKKGIISKVVVRNNYIKRPKIANISQLVFVISSKIPKPDLLLLDKQLAFAEFLKIQPLIIINKTDLDKQVKIKDIYERIGYTVIQTAAKNKEGIEELKDNLKNKISVFSGNSGVGKSTLLNSIFNNIITLEGDISKRNKKGKNTTTATTIYKMEENTYIADTQGFSSFDIYEIESNKLYTYFRELNEYSKNCEFIGCTHIKEQNCGIKQALKEGKIYEGRYNNFVKIYNKLKDKEEHKW